MYQESCGEKFICSTPMIKDSYKKTSECFDLYLEKELRNNLEIDNLKYNLNKRLQLKDRYEKSLFKKSIDKNMSTKQERVNINLSLEADLENILSIEKVRRRTLSEFDIKENVTNSVLFRESMFPGEKPEMSQCSETQNSQKINFESAEQVFLNNYQRNENVSQQCLSSDGTNIKMLLNIIESMKQFISQSNMHDLCSFESNDEESSSTSYEESHNVCISLPSIDGRMKVEQWINRNCQHENNNTAINVNEKRHPYEYCNYHETVDHDDSILTDAIQNPEQLKQESLKKKEKLCDKVLLEEKPRVSTITQLNERTIEDIICDFNESKRKIVIESADDYDVDRHGDKSSGDDNRDHGASQCLSANDSRNRVCSRQLYKQFYQLIRENTELRNILSVFADGEPVRFDWMTELEQRVGHNKTKMEKLTNDFVGRRLYDVREDNDRLRNIIVEQSSMLVDAYQQGGKFLFFPTNNQYCNQ